MPDQKDAIADYLRACMGLPKGTKQQNDAAFEGIVRVIMFFGSKGLMEAMREQGDD